MKLVQNLTKIWLFPMLIVSCAILTACANQGVFHSFGFDMRKDNQDADVLNYRYGTTKRSIQPEEYELKNGRPFYFQSMSGEMTRPDFLYVKWKSRSTGQVFEDTVDLNKRLPKDFENQEVYFMIGGPQLYIYLISNNPRPNEEKPVGPHSARNFKTVMLYPDSAKQKEVL